MDKEAPSKDKISSMGCSDTSALKGVMPIEARGTTSFPISLRMSDDFV